MTYDLVWCNKENYRQHNLMQYSTSTSGQTLHKWIPFPFPTTKTYRAVFSDRTADINLGWTGSRRKKCKDKKILNLWHKVHWSLCMQSAMSWGNTFTVFQKQLQLPSTGRHMGSYKYKLQWYHLPYQPFIMDKVAVSEISEIIPAWYSWLPRNMLLCLLAINDF